MFRILNSLKIISSLILAPYLRLSDLVCKHKHISNINNCPSLSLPPHSDIRPLFIIHLWAAGRGRLSMSEEEYYDEGEEEGEDEEEGDEEEEDNEEDVDEEVIE